MKHLAVLFVAVAVLVSDASFACGSHSCGGDFSVSVNLDVVGGGYGGNYGGGYGYGGGYRPRPLLVGAGAVAFRRARRLAFRANRAAFFGFYGRANRLQARSDAAFNRGMYRNARFNGFF